MIQARRKEIQGKAQKKNENEREGEKMRTKKV